MLSDRERKLLRILHVGRYYPNVESLQTKTGYRRGDILSALMGLEKQGYIVWPDQRIDRIKVIKSWEHELDDKPARSIKPGYWSLH